MAERKKLDRDEAHAAQVASAARLFGDDGFDREVRVRLSDGSMKKKRLPVRRSRYRI